MGEMRSSRLRGAVPLIALLLLAVRCKREIPDGTGALTSSLIFDGASPEVREALASPVDFRLNDDNFARWEEAQRNLEKLPRSAIPVASPARGSAVDRAVARLESSPYTRTAIERTGLSVRDFVLATIALAQATEVAHTGKSISRGPIPPENFQFVQRYSSRALYSQSRATRGNVESYDMDSDADATAEMDLQMRLDETQHQAEMQMADVERQREELERAAEEQRDQAERAAEEQRDQAERAAEDRRVQAERARRDSVRDTLQLR
jgi:hypothetical protein